MKIPTFLELRKKKEVVENQNEKNLLKEFNKFIRAKLPVCGEVSIPCDSKFLCIAKTIQETLITSFTARLYGLRRSKRKTEQIIKELTKDNE